MAVNRGKCPKCEGTGRVHCGHTIYVDECPSTCSGSKRCPECKGSGVTREAARTISIDSRNTKGENCTMNTKIPWPVKFAVTVGILGFFWWKVIRTVADIWRRF